MTSQGSSPRTPGKDDPGEDVPETPSVTTHTKTTLDDLLDTLKQLEEPVRIKSPDMKKPKGPAWCKKKILYCLFARLNLRFRS